ncbi:MAG: TVP38/TMEM64 family protein [Pseudomonadota bacterium]
MPYKKIALVLGIVAVIGVYMWSGMHETLTLENLQNSYDNLRASYLANPVQSVAIYMLAYTLLTALSVPGATIFSLGGAAVFGFWVSLFAVSFASTAGATLACWTSRYLLQSWVRRRFAKFMPKIDEGIQNDGIWYLFSLRLVPAIPFVVVNLVMGLTSMPLRTYAWVSQVGMLAGTAVYLYAGQELGKIRAVSDIFSPTILFAFILISLFPLLARYILRRLGKNSESLNTPK